MWIQTRHPAWPIHVLPTTRTLQAKLGTPQVDMAENVAALKFLCSQLTTSQNSWYPLVNVYIAIENGPVEIVDNYPFNSMVDLSIVFCKGLPGANWFPITYVCSLGFHCSLAGTVQNACFEWKKWTGKRALEETLWASHHDWVCFWFWGIWCCLWLVGYIKHQPKLESYCPGPEGVLKNYQTRVLFLSARQPLVQSWQSLPT